LLTDKHWVKMFMVSLIDPRGERKKIMAKRKKPSIIFNMNCECNILVTDGDTTQLLKDLDRGEACLSYSFELDNGLTTGGCFYPDHFQSGSMILEAKEDQKFSLKVNGTAIIEYDDFTDFEIFQAWKAEPGKIFPMLKGVRDSTPTTHYIDGDKSGRVRLGSVEFHV